MMRKAARRQHTQRNQIKTTRCSPEAVKGAILLVSDVLLQLCKKFSTGTGPATSWQ